MVLKRSIISPVLVVFVLLTPVSRSQNPGKSISSVKKEITETKDNEVKTGLLTLYLTLAEQQANRDTLVDALMKNGRHYFVTREYEQAAPFYERVIGLNVCTIQTAHAHNNLGLVEKKLGKYRSSLARFAEAKLQYEQFGNDRSVARTLINAARVSQLIGDFEREISQLYEALPIVNNLDEPSLKAVLLYSLSIALTNMEAYEEAVEYQKQALNIRKELGNYNNVAVSYNALANTYREWEQYGSAIPYFRKAIQIQDSLKLQQPLSISYHNLASTYTGTKQWDSAWYYYRRSFDIKKAISNKRGIAETSKELAQVALEQGQTDSAGYYLKETEDWLRQSEDMVMRLRTIHIKKDYFIQRGQMDSALYYGEQFVKDYPQYVDNKKGSILKELELKYEENKTLITTLEKEQLQLQQAVILKDLKLKYRNVLLVLSFFVILSLTGLFFWYRSQASLKEIRAHQKGQDAFRKQAAMVLHDEVASKLFGLRLKMAALENGNEIASDQKSSSEELSLLYKKIRQLSHELAPARHHIETQSITEAFANLFSDIERYRNINIDVQGMGDSNLTALKKENQIALYSIIEELLINVSKHSRSDRALVTFAENGNQLSVSVRDYGIGFPKNSGHGMGLKNVYANTKLLRGHFDMTNVKPGFKAILTFPTIPNVA